MGKVLSVDTAKNEIEVVPEVLTDNNSVSSTRQEKILIQSKVALPGCVTIGAKIRLWGERLPEVNTFIAKEIRGCRGGGCSDPTGVRSRLSRRGKHSWSTLNHSNSEDQNTGSKRRGSGGISGGKEGDGNGGGR